MQAETTQPQSTPWWATVPLDLIRIDANDQPSLDWDKAAEEHRVEQAVARSERAPLDMSGEPRTVPTSCPFRSAPEFGDKCWQCGLPQFLHACQGRVYQLAGKAS